MNTHRMPEETPFYAVNLSRRAGRYEDRCPTFVRDREGRCWVTWFSFRDGADEILARRWDERELSPIYTVSDPIGISYRPVIATEGADSIWIFWSAFREGVWNAFGRRYADERWDEAIQLTFGEETDYLPCAATDAQGRVWVAWVSVREGHHRIMVRSRDGRRWSKPMELSEGLKHSFRPVLSAGTDGAVWIAWDSYTDGNYDVYARRCVNEAWSPAMRVSQRDAWEFKPSITVDRGGGVWLVWLSSMDVRNRDDVIDQWPTIRCAHYDGQRWGIQDDVAHLCHGLLPRTSVWGYLGRRRHPMIQADDRGGVWVLWERKDRHDGATGRSVGVLCGRYFDGADWSEPAELHRGKHHYEIASSPNGLDGGRLCLAGYEAFGADGGDLWIGHLDIGSPGELPSLRDESWQGWKPIRLRSAMFREPHRRSVTADGETYTLFWGDLHGHSVLSADAEGEQDELTFYARDKAGLDFFAITDNDFYQRTLTASEWALTRTHAAHANEPGRFVVFSGYEWTQRASEDAPPNHRSIYYLTDDRPIHRWTDPDMQGDVARLGACLRKEQALWHPHHERWEIEEEGAANVEVCSGWLISIERNDASLHEHLRRGHRFGFVGGSDSHRRGPGLGGALVAVYAKALTREALFEALKRRRCYATSGSRIWLDFRVEGRMMGSEFTAYRPPHITLHAVGTTPIQRADLIRNGQTIHSASGEGLELRFEYDDESLPEGTSYYYVRVQQEGTTVSYPSNIAPARGNLAWSSPIWVTM